MIYFDMHSHILPGVDDGCKNVTESLQLINLLLKDGINNICLTPHFYTHHKSIEDFVDKRNEAFEILKESVPENVNLCLGAEVYVTQYLFNNSDISSVCYGNSKYILTEFAYPSSFNGKSMNMLIRIRDNYGLIPVIPHIERYENVFYDYEKLEELTDMGVIIQTNASSLSGFRRKKHILKLINEGLIHILGTDAHSLSKGNPQTYMEACNLIEKKCGRQKLRKMQLKAEEIFNKSN